LRNQNIKRLPVDHPEFRYPESPNPYSVRLRALSGYVYADNATEAHRGRWREVFPDAAKFPSTRELHVEIGTNAAHVILEWARQNPQHAYIGIDWKFKAMHRGVEKAFKRGTQNLLLFRAHADRLKYMFAEKEIDHLYLFFPDPWPKTAHWKNRFVTEKNLRELAALIRPGGMFHIKTDHLGYFEWMETAVSKVKDVWEVTMSTRDLHAGRDDAESLDFPDVTLFEKIFIRDKIPIKAMNLKRR
jgi:tRNA (guanine-N7-)-methyltransferase